MPDTHDSLGGELPIQNSISETAAAWAAKSHHEAGLTEEEQAQLENWLARDPRHREEFEIMKALLTPGAAGSDPNNLSQGIHRQFRFSPALLLWTTGLAAACLILFLSISAFTNQPFEATYLTESSEIRSVALPDGSTIALDAESALSLVFTGSKRSVQLEAGRAFFQVQQDTERPFIVTTTAGEVEVVGTEFELNLLGDATQLRVREGRVKINHERIDNHSQTFGIGDGTFFTADSTSLPMQKFDPSRIAAWESGKLIFENQLLGDVITEIERYTQRTITLESDDLAQTPINGVFETQDLSSFFSAIQQMLDVRVVEVSSREIVIIEI